MLNPQLYPKQILLNKLEPATLAELAQQRVPNSRVNAVLMEANQKATLVITGSRPGGKEQSNKLDFDQMIVDPYSGEELGRRQFGAISQGMINFMPFIYKLHYNLALDSAGMRVLGICALIWIIDCFTGFYLTWPQQCKTRISSIDTSREAVNRNWWQRWQPAWKVRLNSGGYKLNSRQAKRGVTRIFFDANSGELKLLLLPSGQYAENTVTNWLYALHMANVFGLPYRIFVCIAGFVIALLSVTGVIIWMKKRRVRQPALLMKSA